MADKLQNLAVHPIYKHKNVCKIKILKEYFTIIRR